MATKLKAKIHIHGKYSIKIEQICPKKKAPTGSNRYVISANWGLKILHCTYQVYQPETPHTMQIQSQEDLKWYFPELPLPSSRYRVSYLKHFENIGQHWKGHFIRVIRYLKYLMSDQYTLQLRSWRNYQGSQNQQMGENCDMLIDGDLLSSGVRLLYQSRLFSTLLKTFFFHQLSGSESSSQLEL